MSVACNAIWWWAVRYLSDMNCTGQQKRLGTATISQASSSSPWLYGHRHRCGAFAVALHADWFHAAYCMVGTKYRGELKALGDATGDSDLTRASMALWTGKEKVPHRGNGNPSSRCIPIAVGRASEDLSHEQWMIRTHLDLNDHLDRQGNRYLRELWKPPTTPPPPPPSPPFILHDLLKQAEEGVQLPV